MARKTTRDVERGGRPAFRLPTGQVVPCVTASEMREVDRIAVEETGPSLLQMMEHAGRSLTELILSSLERAPGETRIAVIAGPGGNGAGGACAARHLLGRVGEVVLCLAGEKPSGEALAIQRRIFEAHGGGVRELAGLPGAGGFDVIVDAVFGYGLTGAPTGALEEAVAWIAGSGSLVLSLDLPSGLAADGGAPEGAVVRADLTLTLHLPKPGLGSALAGDLFLADLGIPREVNSRLGVRAPGYGAGFVTPLERLLPEGAEGAP